MEFELTNLVMIGIKCTSIRSRPWWPSHKFYKFLPGNVPNVLENDESGGSWPGGIPGNEIGEVNGGNGMFPKLGIVGGGKSENQKIKINHEKNVMYHIVEGTSENQK